MQTKPLVIEDNPAAISPEPSQTVSEIREYYYYVDGGQMPLTPAYEWVVVKFASDLPSVREAALQRYVSFLGPSDQVRDYPDAGVTLLPVKAGTTPQTFNEFIDTMRKDKTGFLQVHPLFQAGNVKMALGDEFVATFPPEKSRAEIDEINSAHGVDLVDAILGQENTFVLRVTPGAELDTLSMANLYQESGLAIFAAPNFIRIQN